MKAKPKMSKVTQVMILDHQEDRYNRVRAAGASTLDLDFIKLETAGGPCPHCKVPWKSIRVQNHYADFEYYQPDCDCYMHCKSCGISMYATTLPNRDYKTYRCPRCGDTGEERWVLLCHVCGVESIKETGPYRQYTCPTCSGGKSKSKRDALRV